MTNLIIPNTGPIQYKRKGGFYRLLISSSILNEASTRQPLYPIFSLLNLTRVFDQIRLNPPVIVLRIPTRCAGG